MSNYAQILQPGVIRFERLLPGPLERVWAHLTESELCAKWLAEINIQEMKPGGRIDMFFLHDRLSPHPDPIPEKYAEMKDGAESVAEITRVDPPHLLAYTWGDGEVEFALSAEGDQVRLVLTHRMSVDDRGEYHGTIVGWHSHLRVLADVLEGRVPEPFWPEHLRLEKEYEERLRDH